MKDVKDAKEILEWLDLLKVGGLGGVSTLGFLQFLKWRKGRRIASRNILSDSSASGIVQVSVEGDGNTVNVTPQTLNLAGNPRALAAVRDALSPVGADGFDRLEVRDGDEIVAGIDLSETDDIISSCNAGIEEAQNLEPDIEETTAWLTVYSPVYDASADRWRFRLGREVIYADISETEIASDSLRRGGAPADDTYQVRLEVTIGRTPDGKRKKPTYRILKVLRFLPANPESQPNFNDKLDSGRGVDDDDD